MNDRHRYFGPDTRVLGTIALVASLGLGLARPGTGQIPEKATLLEGFPTVRVDATQEAATRRPLRADEAAKNQLRIRIVDGRYYWASADDQPLTVSTDGGYTYLTSTVPGRYVRLRRVNDRLTYVEHVDMPAGSVTFWGELRVALGK